MRALTYDRVSADRAQGRSVAEQDADNQAECERRGWTIVARYTDNDAGASRHSRKARPGWQQVQQAIRDREADVLVTWEASRAQRDLKAYAELRDLCLEHGVQWCSNGRLHDFSRTDDRFSTGLDALLAEREADVTRDRVLRAVRANATTGRPHGRLLYGYTRRYDSVTRAFVEQVPDPADGPVVVDIFRRYLAGESMRSIATRLGDPWRLDQVARVLDNPGYAGRRVYQGEDLGPGSAAWPPLIDDTTWLTVKRLRSERKQPYYGRHAARHLLTGILRCGECGTPLSTQKNRGHRAYLCRRGFHVSIAIPKADDFLVLQLLNRLANPDTRAEILRGPDVGHTAAEALAEAERLRADLETFYADAAAEGLSARAVAARERGVLPRIADLERRAGAGVPTAALDVMDDPSAWDDLAVDVRRAIVQAFMRPTLHTVGIGKRGDHWLPERLHLGWVTPGDREPGDAAT